MKKLTEKECIEIGGHCWNYHQGNDIVDEFGNISPFSKTLVYYPNGEPKYRTCKHCGKKQLLQEKQEEWITMIKK